MAAFEDRTSPDLDQFKGGKWTDWLGALHASEPKPQAAPEHSSKRDVEVARLRRPDIGLFGYQPATDKFYLVVCEHCGHLVKPQSLNTHYERKHKNKRITRLPPSSGKRSAHSHSKHTIDKSNHRILPPPHVPKRGATTSQQKTSSHATTSQERSSYNSKSEPVIEKVTVSSDKERRHGDSSNSKNHKTEKAGTKLIAPQPAKLRNTATHDNANSQMRPHLSSKKSIPNKPGGTIQLNEIPESHVVKTSSRHPSEPSSKHQHRHHRTSGSGSKPPSESDATPRDDHKKTDNKTVYDSHVSGSKSRKNHDGYHHHHHQMTNRDSSSDSNPLSPENLKLLSPGGEKRLRGVVPLVVLEKTQISGSVKVGQVLKRSRPVSGSSESSVSPPRPKIPSLHKSTDEKRPPTPSKPPEILPNLAVPAKVKKKEKKILPLKAREYDPNKHCGVWVKEENEPCRRSLTCKVHTLSAKRAVTGRRKQFGELMQDREKQRIKDKATASPATPTPTAAAVAQAIKSPPAPSPIEFAVPSPATKATPLSPPTCTVVTTTTPQTTTAQKTKSSISLFPRVFAAWHVDCWDNDEVSEDATKLQNNCTCIQRHPQPFTVLEFPSRRLGTCQVSYNRRVERQTEALSSNFQKFGSKPSKTPKPFSFSPISGATYRSVHSSIANMNPSVHFYNQVPQRTATNGVFLINRANIAHVSASQNAKVMMKFANQSGGGIPTNGKTSQKSNKNTLSRKLSNLAPPDGSQVKKSVFDATVRKLSGTQQVSDIMKRTVSNTNSDAGHITQANEVHSTSPLFLLNDISQEMAPSPMQMPLVSNVTNANTQMVGLRTAMQSADERIRSVTPANLKSKSAIPKYTTVTQPRTEAMLSEHVDGSPIMVQLPNGINPLSGSVLLKPGAHSVTLSGNIGALTAMGDESKFAGNKLSKKLKTLNSNNNFIVQNEGISPNTLVTKSKQFTQTSLGQPTAITQPNQPLGSATIENFLLQNDEHFLLNPQSAENVLNTVNLNQQYAIQNSNFSEPVTLEQQPKNNASSTADILRVLCSPAENCESLQGNLDKHNLQLSNINQIDPAILEQVFGNQNTQIAHNRLPMDAMQGCSTSNPTRTADLGQNFMTR